VEVAKVLVAVISPPDPEQQVLEDLVRTRVVDISDVVESRGPWTVEPIAASEFASSPAQAFVDLRESEDR
jgi:hypothetical protein